MALKLEPSIHPPPSLSPTTHESSSTFLSLQRSKPSHQSSISNSLSTKQTHLQFLANPANSSTYASVLESCKCPSLGKQVHAHAIKDGFHGHEFVETKLLQMYGKCGCLDDATLLFDEMPIRNLYSWTAILSVYIDHGFFEEALLLFQELQSDGLGLEFFVFPVALKISSGYGGIKLGRQLHGIVIKNGFVSNIYVGNALIDMYGKCKSLDDAVIFFDDMEERDCVSWNSIVSACAANGMVYEALEFLQKMSVEGNWMPNLVSWSAVISGFSQNGYDGEAIEMLYKMQAAGFEPNAQTLSSVLPACARLQTRSLGKEIHGYITRHGFMSNPFVVNGLIDVYRRCSDMESALKIFSKFSVKNMVSYNTIIVGYCENGEIFKAREFFDRMELAGMEKDIISWNSMISGYVDNQMFDKSLELFQDLMTKEGIKTDSFTLGSALSACANIGSLRFGKEIHSQAIIRGLQSNPFVGGALVEMYCKCKDLNAAQMAFDQVTEKDTATWNGLISGYARCNQIENVEIILRRMREKGFDPNVYTWNGIIAGYVENGFHKPALQLFSEIQASNFQPDIYTIGTILPACSRLATIERGKQVHAHSIRKCYESDSQIGASLVDMYAKCGSLTHARLAYNRIRKHNLVTQNSMLTAYSMHGYGEEGISFFRRMLIDGFRPDSVTFLSVLSSCVHAGSVEAGQEFFNLMQCYNVKPTIKHYTSMVDLFSRAGQLNEAYKVFDEMPDEPDSVMWGALLGGCVIHGDVDVGEIAAERLIDLEPDNTGNYVMLANLYASVGRWSDLARVRQLMEEKQMHKSPGWSWIEDRDEIHVFVACDTSHEKTEEIYATLGNLTVLIRLQQD